MHPQSDKRDSDAAEVGTTHADVGSEGGSPGNVEIVRHRAPGAGTEATETWRPWSDHTDTIARDETGKGRRSP
jgi:hypothetical protein